MVNFEFDENKSRSNFEKHGTDFYTAQGLWTDSDLIEIPANTSDEPRYLVQGERMIVHFSTIFGMPAAKTFSKKLGFMRQRFCLATKLILVGSARTMFEAMCRRQAKFAAPLSL